MVVSPSEIQAKRPRKETQKKSECDGSDRPRRITIVRRNPRLYNTGSGHAVQRNALQA